MKFKSICLTCTNPVNQWDMYVFTYTESTVTKSEGLVGRFRDCESSNESVQF